MPFKETKQWCFDNKSGQLGQIQKKCFNSSALNCQDKVMLLVLTHCDSVLFIHVQEAYKRLLLFKRTDIIYAHYILSFATLELIYYKLRFHRETDRFPYCKTFAIFDESCAANLHQLMNMAVLVHFDKFGKKPIPSIIYSHPKKLGCS